MSERAALYDLIRSFGYTTSSQTGELADAILAARPANSAQHSESNGRNQDFACFLIDHCEGEKITEESILMWLSLMMNHPNYVASSEQPPDSSAQPPKPLTHE
jgi:hypothetical protein